MAQYNISQIAYAGQRSCLEPYPLGGDSTGRIQPANILGSQSPIGDLSGGLAVTAPYQQIILNKKYEDGTSASGTWKECNQVFDRNNVYYVKFKIPKNPNYDLNFALLLIPRFGDAGDLDRLNYQFLRYIHVPRVEASGKTESVVVLYEEPTINENGSYSYRGFKQANEDIWDDYENVKVKIAKPLLNENGSLITVNDTAGNYFYYIENHGTFDYYQPDSEGKIISDDNAGATWSEKLSKYKAGTWYGQNRDKFAPIGRATAILNHSWLTEDSEEYYEYELIFQPRTEASSTNSAFYHLYLYLIPERFDNDILWLYQNNITKEWDQYHGRHVDLDKVQAECYVVKNLLGEGMIPKRIGIWGRSELMFSINGEELRIPPSGYYELQDFDVVHLGVVAKTNQDQFTIDLQY